MRDLVVAMTGASGSVYATRLLEVLLSAGHTVHLTISPAATDVLSHELGHRVDLQNFNASDLLASNSSVANAEDLPTRNRLSTREESASQSDLGATATRRNQLVYHHYQDYHAGIASGSFLTAGMVICPCSMGTLSAIATGASSNLIHRAADVHLKERRKLIVVPRETPLGSIQLANMKTLADAGAIVLPAMPGFYHQPKTVQDLVDFVVGRICDHLGVAHDLFDRWPG